MPASREGRNNMRPKTQGIPPAPSPSEGRFTDWSSLGSPMQELHHMMFPTEK